MKKICTVIFFTCAALLQFGCGGGSDNANQANSNLQTAPTPTANTNSNVTAQVTPLPEFTDADTAFAEGNKLFDANKTEMAVEAYNQAVKLNPEFAEAWFKLGVSYALIEKQNEVEALNEEVDESITPTPTPKKSKSSKKLYLFADFITLYI